MLYKKYTYSIIYTESSILISNDKFKPRGLFRNALAKKSIRIYIRMYVFIQIRYSTTEIKRYPCIIRKRFNTAIPGSQRNF